MTSLSIPWTSVTLTIFREPSRSRACYPPRRPAGRREREDRDADRQIVERAHHGERDGRVQLVIGAPRAHGLRPMKSMLVIASCSRE
jgi:hypothetical protein